MLGHEEQIEAVESAGAAEVAATPASAAAVERAVESELADAAELADANLDAAATSTETAAAADGAVSGEREHVDHAAKVKLAGLIAFFVVMAVIVVVIWPYLHMLFEEGGPATMVARLRGAGPLGVLVLLGLQFLQIVVAFIPGEVVQLAAGLMYGPWLGTLIVLVGCVFSSAIIYQLVHKLGAPFVQGMVSTRHLDRFRAFEESGKLDVFVFILFLIPGLPKDVFTYLVPLTTMDIKRFLLLTTIGRIPGVFASTLAANGLAEGNYASSIIILAVVAAIAVVAILFHEPILAKFGRGKHHGSGPNAG